MGEKFGMCFWRPGALFLAAALACAVPAWAREGGHDHDRAMRAVEAGQALPLRTILERVEQDYPGQVLEVELEPRDEGWVYEITVLQAGGALVRLKVNAKDGTVLRSKEHGDPARRHGERR